MKVINDMKIEFSNKELKEALSLTSLTKKSDEFEILKDHSQIDIVKYNKKYRILFFGCKTNLYVVNNFFFDHCASLIKNQRFSEKIEFNEKMCMKLELTISIQKIFFDFNFDTMFVLSSENLIYYTKVENFKKEEIIFEISNKIIEKSESIKKISSIQNNSFIYLTQNNKLIVVNNEKKIFEENDCVSYCLENKNFFIYFHKNEMIKFNIEKKEKDLLHSFEKFNIEEIAIPYLFSLNNNIIFIEFQKEENTLILKHFDTIQKKVTILEDFFDIEFYAFDEIPEIKSLEYFYEEKNYLFLTFNVASTVRILKLGNNVELVKFEDDKLPILENDEEFNPGFMREFFIYFNKIEGLFPDQKNSSEFKDNNGTPLKINYPPFLIFIDNNAKIMFRTFEDYDTTSKTLDKIEFNFVNRPRINIKKEIGFGSESIKSTEKGNQINLFNKPSEGSLFNKPSEGSFFNKPSEVNMFNKPSEGSFFNKPSEVNMFNKPSEGSFFNKPSEVNMFNKPSEGNLFNKPGEGNLFNKSVEGNLINKPTDDGLMNKLLNKPGELNLFNNKPADGSFFNKPTEGILFNKPTEGSFFNKPTEGSFFNKPTEGNLFNKPGEGSLFNKSGEGTLMNKKPVEESLINKPVEGGFFNKKLDEVNLFKQPGEGNLFNKSGEGTLFNKLTEGGMLTKSSEGGVIKKPAEATIILELGKIPEKSNEKPLTPLIDSKEKEVLKEEEKEIKKMEKAEIEEKKEKQLTDVTKNIEMQKELDTKTKTDLLNMIQSQINDFKNNKKTKKNIEKSLVFQKGLEDNLNEEKYRHEKQMKEIDDLVEKLRELEKRANFVNSTVSLIDLNVENIVENKNKIFNPREKIILDLKNKKIHLLEKIEKLTKVFTNIIGVGKNVLNEKEQFFKEELKNDQHKIKNNKKNNKIPSLRKFGFKVGKVSNEKNFAPVSEIGFDINDLINSDYYCADLQNENKNFEQQKYKEKIGSKQKNEIFLKECEKIEKKIYDIEEVYLQRKTLKESNYIGYDLSNFNFSEKQKIDFRNLDDKLEKEKNISDMNKAIKNKLIRQYKKINKNPILRNLKNFETIKIISQKMEKMKEGKKIENFENESQLKKTITFGPENFDFLPHSNNLSDKTIDPKLENNLNSNLFSKNLQTSSFLDFGVQKNSLFNSQEDQVKKDKNIPFINQSQNNSLFGKDSQKNTLFPNNSSQTNSKQKDNLFNTNEINPLLKNKEININNQEKSDTISLFGKSANETKINNKNVDEEKVDSQMTKMFSFGAEKNKTEEENLNILMQTKNTNILKKMNEEPFLDTFNNSKSKNEKMIFPNDLFKKDLDQKVNDLLSPANDIKSNLNIPVSQSNIPIDQSKINNIPSSFVINESLTNIQTNPLPSNFSKEENKFSDINLSDKKQINDLSHKEAESFGSQNKTIETNTLKAEDKNILGKKEIKIDGGLFSKNNDKKEEGGLFANINNVKKEEGGLFANTNNDKKEGGFFSNKNVDKKEGGLFANTNDDKKEGGFFSNKNVDKKEGGLFANTNNDKKEGGFFSKLPTNNENNIKKVEENSQDLKIQSLEKIETKNEDKFISPKKSINNTVSLIMDRKTPKDKTEKNSLVDYDFKQVESIETNQNLPISENIMQKEKEEKTVTNVFNNTNFFKHDKSSLFQNNINDNQQNMKNIEKEKNWGGSNLNQNNNSFFNNINSENNIKNQNSLPINSTGNNQTQTFFNVNNQSSNFFNKQDNNKNSFFAQNNQISENPQFNETSKIGNSLFNQNQNSFNPNNQNPSNPMNNAPLNKPLSFGQGSFAFGQTSFSQVNPNNQTKNIKNINNFSMGQQTNTKSIFSTNNDSNMNINQNSNTNRPSQLNPSTNFFAPQSFGMNNNNNSGFGMNPQSFMNMNNSTQQNNSGNTMEFKNIFGPRK